MSEQRPVYEIEEDAHLAQSIDVTKTLWPDLVEDRTALLMKILESGAKHISDRAASKLARRKKAIGALIDLGSDIWPENWNVLRKSEWPD
ncbi:MAG: hypothetical protein ACKOFA_06120 [Rhodoluna sp.]